MILSDRRAVPEVAAGVSLVISVSDDADEEEFENDMSDEESDDEHDENGKNEFEDIEEAAYFLNPFGTLRIECICSFALYHENLQLQKLRQE